MPVHSKRITDTVARALPPPAAGYAVYWCPATPGLGVRVTAAGARAWIAERRVDGKTVRRTLGKAAGAAAISADAARREQLDRSSELQRGHDRLVVKKAARAAEKIEAVTLEAALKAYVKGKRRAKDGLALKPRTVADYLAMLAPAGSTKTGRRTLPGELHTLAARPVHKVTGDDIRRLHAALEPRGERRQTYALQVLRAVLRHHGVTIDGNPLSTTTPGAQRVALAPSRGNPSPIPPEKLSAWWRAACAEASTGADQLRFMLLTGARPGEAAGLLVGDVDLVGMRAVLRDTKNRKDHTLVLAQQAGVIAHWHAQGKKATEKVFALPTPAKGTKRKDRPLSVASTLDRINAAAGTAGVTPHKLRHTFATIADDIATAATARAMMNHASGDVAQVHYIGVGEAKLRAAWQAVADFIEAAK